MAVRQNRAIRDNVVRMVWGLDRMPNIDSARLAAEFAADADVIRSLQGTGDTPSVVRPVDVRFVGDLNKIEALKAAISGLKWRVLQVVAVSGTEWACDVERDQSTDEAAIRSLTEDALQIEVEWDVRYDGWGTVAIR